MYTLEVENIRHEILELTHCESDYQILSIDGLNPPQATINRSKIVGLDGSKFNSSRVEDRNIVILVKLNGDVEANRLKLYQYFNTKQWCKLYYKNRNRDVYIEGYVETMEVSPFTKDETVQISIICPEPYFKSAQAIIDDVSKITSMFTFPFAIDSGDPIEFSAIENSRVTNVYNESESETGLTITITVGGPVSKIKLVDVVNNEWLELIRNFIQNDIITINTNRGQKSIKLTRNGVDYNIFASMTRGSTFFQLEIGDNFFSYLADDGDSDELLSIIFEHVNMYRGV